MKKKENEILFFSYFLKDETFDSCSFGPLFRCFISEKSSDGSTFIIISNGKGRKKKLFFFFFFFFLAGFVRLDNQRLFSVDTR
jgi:hypothetical protein